MKKMTHKVNLLVLREILKLNSTFKVTFAFLPANDFCSTTKKDQIKIAFLQIPQQCCPSCCRNRLQSQKNRLVSL